MAKSSQYKKCMKCGHKGTLVSGESLDSRTCSMCGSNRVVATIEICETIRVVVDHRLQFDGSNTSRTQAKKERVDYKFGYDWWRDGEKFVYRYQEVNRPANRYCKFVQDPETGKVLRYCNEPLDEHRSGS